MDHGELKDFTYFGTIVRDCLLAFPTLKADPTYDFARLSKAMPIASELLSDSIELFNLGKDAFAIEELVRGLATLVVGIAQGSEPSHTLSNCLIAVCKAILTIEDIPCELNPGQDERELFRVAIYSQSFLDKEVEEVLNRWVKHS